MVTKSENTTVRVKKGTLAKLKSIGRKGETYDEVILRLMEGK